MSYRDLVLDLRTQAIAAGARFTESDVDQGGAKIVLDATGAKAGGYATTRTWRGAAREVIVHLTQPDAENPRALPVTVRVVPGPDEIATVTVTSLAAKPFSDQAVHDLVAAVAPGLRPDGPLSTHPVNAAFAPESSSQGRVLLLGEAAGLVNPFTGDGIGNAIRSAEIAVSSVLEHWPEPERIASAYRSGLRSAFVGYFESARHAVRHYHLAWRILSSSARSDHPFYRQGHRAVLLGGAAAHTGVAARNDLPAQIRLYLTPFTLACNEVMVRSVGDEWPLLAIHNLGDNAADRGVRPATMLAGALMSSGAHPDAQHAPVAAAIELALLGALAHTVPASEATALRRGVDWRYASAVIAADYLLAKATNVITTRRPDLAATFAAWLASLVALRAEGNVTALFESVFEFPARIGGYLAGADDQAVAVLRHFGRCCGRLFLVSEDLGLLTGRPTRLDTSMAGALAAGLSSLPAGSAEIGYRRQALTTELEATRAAVLTQAESLLDDLPEARSGTVLRHFARALGEPGSPGEEASR